MSTKRKLKVGSSDQIGEKVLKKRKDSEIIEVSPNEPIPTTSKMTTVSNRKIWDKHCWECHKENTTFRCSTCEKSYHSHCLGDQTIQGTFVNWICPPCLDVESASEKKNSQIAYVRELNNLLRFTVNRLVSDTEFTKVKTIVDTDDPISYSQKLVNPIDLNAIAKKVEESKYSSTNEFIMDIKWIRHNCEIAFPDDSKMARITKDLQRFCEREMYDIEICADCFRNANEYDDWFAQMCDRPHLLVWAKIRGSPFWPAKALAMKKNHVDVRFFGERKYSFLPVDNVRLFSEVNPNESMTQANRKRLDTCMEEVERYIDNLKAKYGEFRYARLGANFRPDSINTHLKAMLPNMQIDENVDYLPSTNELTNQRTRSRSSNSISITPNNPDDGNLRVIHELRVTLERCPEAESILEMQSGSNAEAHEGASQQNCADIPSNNTISIRNSESNVNAGDIEPNVQMEISDDVESIDSLICLSETDPLDGIYAPDAQLNVTAGSSSNGILTTVQPAASVVKAEITVTENDENSSAPSTSSPTTNNSHPALSLIAQLLEGDQANLKSVKRENQKLLDENRELRLSLINLKTALDNAKNNLNAQQFRHADALYEQKRKIESAAKSKRWCTNCESECYFEMLGLNYCNLGCAIQTWLKLSAQAKKKNDGDDISELQGY